MTIKDLPIIYNLDRVRVYNKNGLVSSFNRNSRYGLVEQVEQHRTQLFTGNIVNEKIDSMSICVEGMADNVVVLEIHIK